MLDLDLVKNHCRVDVDFIEDDELLRQYTGAALESVSDHIRRKIYADQEALDAAADETGVVINERVTLACLLLIATWYNSRESVVVGTIVARLPDGVERLLWRLKDHAA